MSAHSHGCGCGGAGCGCCEGVAISTPVPIDNRRGLPELAYRVGTHGRFLASMKARLATAAIDLPADGERPARSLRPLQALTTRDAADPAIALLDAWATVGDVLSFYQERIANEGYLRTATERRSLVELARLVGYAPRPGVSSSVYLSYTVDDNQTVPVELPVGTRSQSIPGPDELPQSFETDEPLLARREWNDLQIRRQRPQRIVLATILALDSVHAVGIATGVQVGELLLFRFGSFAGPVHVARRVIAVEPDFAGQRTALRLQPLPALEPAAHPLLETLLSRLVSAQDTQAISNCVWLLDALRLGAPRPPLALWADFLEINVDDDEASQAIADFAAALAQLQTPGAPLPGSGPDEVVDSLLKPNRPQAANSLRLRRGLGEGFRGGADLQPQLITDFAPKLKENYYDAWRGSRPPQASAQLQAVYALAPGETLFGATTAKPMPELDGNTVPSVADWNDWRYEIDEFDTNAYLAKADPLLAAGDLVLVSRPGTPSSPLPRNQVLQVAAVHTGPRSAYGISGETTGIHFGVDGKPTAWREVDENQELKKRIDELRQTWVHPQRRRLEMAQEPILGDVSGSELELGPLHEQLKSGRWIVVEGERSDIDGIRGVRASELLMVAGLEHGSDYSLPGDRPHTTLRLATPMAYTYYREGLLIRANVVRASHGESRKEVLGSSDARRPLQRFALRQPPLTWRPAPTAAGAASTLKVLVGGVEWREVDSLSSLGPDARAYVSATGDDGVTAVIFGDGEHGLRPPSGFENLRAEYRNGIGKGGNVRAKQVSLLVSRPLGIKDVVNPLPASGGAERETAALIRENAPRSLAALDRLVSLSDYADFTRMFAGIAKAEAARLSDGMREQVHITVAGVDDMPLDPNSDLYRNLLQALRELGDPGLSVQVAMRERIALVLQARLRLQAGHRWEPVASAVRARLLERFGFEQRALAQPALLCELVAAMQSVRGVDWVDVDSFGGIPQTVIDWQSGQRRLVRQDEITGIVQTIVYGDSDTGQDDEQGRPVQPPARVDAGAAYREGERIRPARLACFVPSVPDTLILNPVQ
ncbi:putative baseplate assembly protein [Lysobacter sp. BMK333-48F3]|uniref:putative baseplate assembly protein n=1 Tax=Lysobacter sp. BMK333-48F3 TaxID=2867962 RepID=UPI001C8C4F8F|nr:putative baseplate assembly protein [Lysobacter sp. BMK333-48F3]MBX9403060.1 putative baseplate assembly protein [Lysobacter sp. BMK333-48F3]